MNPGDMLADPWFIAFAPVGLIVVIIIWYLIEGS